MEQQASEIRQQIPGKLLITEGGLRDGLFGWKQFGHLQYDARLAAERSYRKPMHQGLMELSDMISNGSDSDTEQ